MLLQALGTPGCQLCRGSIQEVPCRQCGDPCGEGCDCHILVSPDLFSHDVGLCLWPLKESSTSSLNRAEINSSCPCTPSDFLITVTIMKLSRAVGSRGHGKNSGRKKGGLCSQLLCGAEATPTQLQPRSAFGQSPPARPAHLPFTWAKAVLPTAASQQGETGGCECWLW